MNQVWEAITGNVYHKASTLHLVGKLILTELGGEENADHGHCSEDIQPGEGDRLTQACTQGL